MQIKKFGYHGKDKGHVVVLRTVCGKKLNKRVNVKLIDGKWLAANGFDYTEKILNFELSKEMGKLNAN